MKSPGLGDKLDHVDGVEVEAVFVAGRDRSQEHAVVPVEGLGDEGERGAAAVTKENCRDGDTPGVLALGVMLGNWAPGVVAPVGGASGLGNARPFPRHVSVLGEGLRVECRNLAESSIFKWVAIQSGTRKIDSRISACMYEI